MTDLSALHDDEIVAEMQVRLARGTVGFHGLYAAHQTDYRAAYHQVCLLSARWNNESTHTFDSRFVRELRGLLNELGTFRAVDPGVFAVNTTFHGKETAFQDHQPRREDAA
jgi:hypothetical protein